MRKSRSGSRSRRARGWRSSAGKELLSINSRRWDGSGREALGSFGKLSRGGAAAGDGPMSFPTTDGFPLFRMTGNSGLGRRLEVTDGPRVPSQALCSPTNPKFPFSPEVSRPAGPRPGIPPSSSKDETLPRSSPRTRPWRWNFIPTEPGSPEDSPPHPGLAAAPSSRCSHPVRGVGCSRRPRSHGILGAALPQPRFPGAGGFWE